MAVKASYLITHRESDDSRRRDNLQAVLDWLTGFPEFEVIVVEQDSAPRLENIRASAACRHFYAYNPGPFNKSWGLNFAFRQASTALLAFGDGDIIVPGAQMAKAVEICARAYAAVNPYRRIVDLTPDESETVRRSAFDFTPKRAPGGTLNRDPSRPFEKHKSGRVRPIANSA